MAFSFICLTLSLVRSNFAPISSKVKPYTYTKEKHTSFPSVSVDNDLSISLCKDSLISSILPLGYHCLPLHLIKNCSSSANGASTETCLPLTFIVSLTLSQVNQEQWPVLHYLEVFQICLALKMLC